ncbi:site-specific integrase [Sinorhizobium meliloti]|uniref:site-specific integrase n=1 Tax=Rhizobium meliloti TaxID=382 RepID=UPI001F4776CB|nr:site-specific integrase [Sinorhizobium meliloti]
MSDHNAPSLSTLVQRFFLEHLGQHRAVSRETVAAYRDTLRLLLGFAAQRLHRTPSAITLLELDAPLLLAFLDHLEKERGNSVRSRNARLAAIRTFLKYAGHHDIGALATIERALAIPQKRFERPMVGFLSRDESAPSSRPRTPKLGLAKEIVPCSAPCTIQARAFPR